MTADEVREAAKNLAAARVRYANAFVLNKTPQGGIPVTDKTAQQMTISITADEVTVAQAEYDIALAMLRQGA